MSQKIYFGVILFSLLFMAACGAESGESPNNLIVVSAEPNVVVQEEVPTIPAESPETESESLAYPAPDGYPGPNTGPNVGGLERNSESLAEANVQVPQASADTASIGGVLMSERIDEETYYPLVPTRLLLGEIISSEEGDPMFLSAGDGSISAQVFDTGVFVFQNIPPGTYGLIVDIAVTTYPVRGDDGTMLLFTVSGGETINLGELLAEIPTDQN